MKHLSYEKVSDTDLTVLIAGLLADKKRGLVSSWRLSRGKRIEPLDVVLELRDLRVRGKP